MNQDKWTQQLRDKLAEHEAAAPDGLWDDIESALAGGGAAPVPARNSRTRFVALRRWAAAAAVAAIVAGGGLVLYNTYSEHFVMEQEYADNMIIEHDDGLIGHNDGLIGHDDGLIGHDDGLIEHDDGLIGHDDGLIGHDDDMNSHDGGLKSQQAVSPGHRPGAEGSDSPALEKHQHNSNDFALSESTTQNTQDVKDTCTVGTTPYSEDTNTVETVPRVSPSNGGDSQSPRRNNPVKKKMSPRPSLNLYAMNGLGTKDNSNAVIMADALAEKYANTLANSHTGRRLSPIYLTGYEEQEHHYQPVSFGLSVNYPLNQRLSLTSGIVYTRLHSEFSQIIHSQSISQEQTLHYVGIPLGMSYRLWQSGARTSLSAKRQGTFTVYVAAGVQADWNVGTRLITEGVESQMNRDRMQWSANASLGVQYNLLRQLALYAEPGINHYFDNGSNVQNFFKNKPTSLKLQFGLRIDLQSH